MCSEPLQPTQPTIDKNGKPNCPRLKSINCTSNELMNGSGRSLKKITKFTNEYHYFVSFFIVIYRRKCCLMLQNK